jgi:hypothetical protein
MNVYSKSTVIVKVFQCLETKKPRFPKGWKNGAGDFQPLEKSSAPRRSGFQALEHLVRVYLSP